MLKTDLYEFLANGENSGVEFKRDDISPEKLAKEVVAFANLNGGRIFLGVEDDGGISGLARANAQEWVLNAFRDKVYPQIIPFYEEVLVEKGTRIGVITVPAGLFKPYVVRHNGRDDIYVRMGNRSEIATREQQMRLFQSGGMLHVEALPVAGTSFEDLDGARLENYLADILHEPGLPAGRQKWTDRLSGLGLMADDGLGNTVCSIAGLVCFGIRPRKFLRHAGLRLMAFSGTDMAYRAEIDKTLDLPMVGRFACREGDATLQDAGLVDAFLDYFEPYLTEESDRLNPDFRRDKTWIYPLEAVREAVVNALVHRDWTRQEEITVVAYSDRLEITSPGKLRNSMTIEKMLAGRRSPRNPLIVDVMRDYRYVDARGMGVRTKIIPSMRRQNLPDPIFKETDDYVRVILPRGPECPAREQ